MVQLKNLTASEIKILIDRVLTTRRLSKLDQASFMQTMLAKPLLSDDDKQQVDYIFAAIRAGKIRIVD